jgi:hypothetical protein
VANRLLVLQEELVNDPLGRGYAGMDDQQAADDLNTEYREQNITEMQATIVINAVDKAEFNALTDVEQRLVWDILHMGVVNPWGIEADLFVGIFGVGSNTITNLQAIRKGDISRAEELGLGIVTVQDVTDARAAGV